MATCPPSTSNTVARELGIPFQLSDEVAAIYGQAVSRYGAAEGELLSVALIEEKRGSGCGTGPCHSSRLPSLPGSLGRSSG